MALGVAKQANNTSEVVAIRLAFELKNLFTGVPVISVDKVNNCRQLTTGRLVTA